MQSISYNYFALAAAACWAFSALTSLEPSCHLGAFAFARWRVAMVSVLLWVISWMTGGWHTLTSSSVQWLGLGGLIGVFVGDTALYAAVVRLGPRRAGILFSMNAVFSVFLGVFILHESLNMHSLWGIALTCLGVMIAILWGRRKQETHFFEDTQGSVWFGILLGLVAAVCQSMGAFISKPVMAQGIDAFSATAIRTSASALAHSLCWISGLRVTRVHHPLTFSIAWKTIWNAFVGMGLGTTFLLIALHHGNLGIVSVLSAVTPVLVLPLLWWRIKQVPAIGAWVGAILTIAGTAIILRY